MGLNGYYGDSVNYSGSINDTIQGVVITASETGYLMGFRGYVQPMAACNVKFAIYDYVDSSSSFAGGLLGYSNDRPLTNTDIVYYINAALYDRKDTADYSGRVYVQSGVKYYLTAMCDQECYLYGVSGAAAAFQATRTYEDNYADPCTGESYLARKYMLSIEVLPYRYGVIGYSGNNSAVRTNSFNLNDRIRVSYSNCPYDGTLDKFFVYADSNWGAGENATAAVYSHSSGRLIAQTAEFTGVGADGWLSASFGPSSVVGGETYKLAVWGDENAKSLMGYRNLTDDIDYIYKDQDYSAAGAGGDYRTQDPLPITTFANGSAGYLLLMFATINQSSDDLYITEGYRELNLLQSPDPNGPVSIEARYFGTKIKPRSDGYLHCIGWTHKNTNHPAWAADVYGAVYATGNSVDSNYVSGLIAMSDVGTGYPSGPNQVRPNATQSVARVYFTDNTPYLDSGTTYWLIIMSEVGTGGIDVYNDGTGTSATAFYSDGGDWEYPFADPMPLGTQNLSGHRYGIFGVMRLPGSSGSTVVIGDIDLFSSVSTLSNRDGYLDVGYLGNEMYTTTDNDY